MSEKICRDCGETKDLSQFFKHKQMLDGHLHSCKTCRSNYEKERRKNHPEISKQYENVRSKLPHRIELNTTVGKQYIKNNPERYIATNKVNNSLRDGKLQRLPCICCGNTKVVAHHVSYDLPLDVVWLCQKHHKETHAAIS